MRCALFSFFLFFTVALSAQTVADTVDLVTGELHLLKADGKIFLRYGGNQPAELRLDNYQTVLRTATTRAHSAFHKRIDRTEYRLPYLVALVEEYNGRTWPAPGEEVPGKDRLGLSFYVEAALLQPSFRMPFRDVADPGFGERDFQATTQFGGGVQVGLIANVWVGAGLRYYAAEMTNPRTFDNPPLPFTIDLSLLQIPVEIVYQRVGAAITPVISAGYVYSQVQRGNWTTRSTVTTRTGETSGSLHGYRGQIGVGIRATPKLYLQGMLFYQYDDRGRQVVLEGDFLETWNRGVNVRVMYVL